MASERAPQQNEGGSGAELKPENYVHSLILGTPIEWLATPSGGVLWYTGPMRVAVVGHVEWLRFVAVERLPGRGDIVHSHDDWEEVGGGGGSRRSSSRSCADETHFFTLLGEDELGRRAKAELEAGGVIVHAVAGAEPTRWAFVHCDEGGERTITTVGPKPHPRGHDERLPWDELRETDAVFFTAGDVDALRAARRARVLVATARELGTLRRAGVELDALVRSGEDEAEVYRPGDLDPEPKLVVTTSGALGGWMQPGGPYVAAPPPVEVVDAFGAGDSFMAGLTYALGRGLEPADAVAFAARCGAAALTWSWRRAAAPSPLGHGWHHSRDEAPARRNRCRRRDRDRDRRRGVGARRARR